MNFELKQSVDRSILGYLIYHQAKATRIKPSFTGFHFGNNCEFSSGDR